MINLNGKKGVSLMIGYIILITIAIIISTIVYQQLKTYVPTDSIQCTDGVSILLDKVVYQCDNNTLGITIKNTGRFNIAGYYISASNKSSVDIGTIDLSKYTSTGKGGVVYLGLSATNINPFAPNKEAGSTYDLSNTSIGRLYFVQINPVRYENINGRNQLVNCGNARIKEALSCYSGTNSGSNNQGSNSSNNNSSNSTSPTLTQIDYSGFESGTQGWTFSNSPNGNPDSNRDNARSDVTDTGASGGTWSAHLQDNTGYSNFYKDFDFSNSSYVNVSFYYYPSSIDTGEYVQLYCGNTEVWRFTNGDHGENAWYFGSANITKSDCTFNSTTRLRFEGINGLSSNFDDLWVDGVNITGTS